MKTVSKSLRTMNNLYSDYSCGQEVMAQRFRMADPSINTYCPGIINRIISNNYYEIKFNDNNTQILKKSYFYVNNPKNKEEQYNYLSKLNTLYGVGASVTVNKNYYKNLSPSYVSATITDGTYDSGEFSVELDNGINLNNVPLDEIITACDSYSNEVISKVSEEETEEEISESVPSCQKENIFSPSLMVMQNKKVFGYIQITLSIITFLIIGYKIFIKFPILSQYESQITMIKNIFMSLISIGTIFLAIILINKKTINVMNFLILLSVFFLIFLFTYVSKNKEPVFLFDSIIKQGRLIDFDKFCQMVWSFIFPISIGPFYLLAYFLLFIPMLIVDRIKSLSKYKINCLDFFYGRIPSFLGHNKALYIFIISLFCLLYLYLITYFFDGYIDVSDKTTQNNLTSNPLVQLSQVGKGVLSFSKKYIYEVVFWVLAITFVVFNSIYSIFKIPTSMLILVIFLIFIVYYFIIRIGIPYINNQLNPSVKVKEFDVKNNSFKVEILDFNKNVIGTKYVLPENIGKQLKSDGIKINDYNKSNGKFTLEILTSTESKIVSVKSKNLVNYLSSNTISNLFKVKKYVKKGLDNYELSDIIDPNRSTIDIMITIAVWIGVLIAFIILIIILILISRIVYEKYGNYSGVSESISEDVVSSLNFY